MFSLTDNLKACKHRSAMTSLPVVAEEINNFLVEVSLVKQTPDLSKIFDNQFIKAYTVN